MKNNISIIVPVRNGADTLYDCLKSVFEYTRSVQSEVIVVDDGSDDNTAAIAKQFPCVYIRIEKSGAAKARNTGIAKATGDILIFFDADVILNNDTIEKFIFHLNDDSDAYIIQGRWAEESPVNTFCAEFFLFNYHFYFRKLFIERNRFTAANLETGCLAARKEVFNDFTDGFNENYKSAGGEEHEFGFRLLSKYKIYYYNDIFVKHKFGSVARTLKKIFFRTINYSMLVFNDENQKRFKEHKIFVPVKDRLNLILIAMFFLNFIFLIIAPIWGLKIFGCIIIFYLINILDFFIYLMKKKNIIFALKGVLTDLLLIFVKFAALVISFIMYYFFNKKNYKI